MHTTMRSRTRVAVFSLTACTVGLLLGLLWLRRDYAWLLIALYRFSPPARGRCEPFPGRAAPGRAVPRHASLPPRRTEERLRFGIMMVFDDGMLELPLTQLSIANKRVYAARHGYELLVLHGPLAVDASRPAAWSKFRNLKAHLPRFDYVCFMDVDTLVTNLAAQLEDLVRPGGGDFIASQDWNGVNTGVFLLRNSPWSQWLLEEAWGAKGSEQEHMALHERSADGIAYPFEFEQRAIHYLLQTDKWRERGLPQYLPAEASSGDVSENAWAHVEIVPQCAINAYMLFPRPFSAAASAAWAPGDFIVHLAGHKGSNKLALFRYCADLAKRGA